MAMLIGNFFLLDRRRLIPALGTRTLPLFLVILLFARLTDNLHKRITLYIASQVTY
jgi:hypothetical protein